MGNRLGGDYRPPPRGDILGLLLVLAAIGALTLLLSRYHW